MIWIRFVAIESDENGFRISVLSCFKQDGALEVRGFFDRVVDGRECGYLLSVLSNSKNGHFVEVNLSPITGPFPGDLIGNAKIDPDEFLHEPEQFHRLKQLLIGMCSHIELDPSVGPVVLRTTLEHLSFLTNLPPSQAYFCRAFAKDLLRAMSQGGEGSE